MEASVSDRARHLHTDSDPPRFGQAIKWPGHALKSETGSMGEPVARFGGRLAVCISTSRIIMNRASV